MSRAPVISNTCLADKTADKYQLVTMKCWPANTSISSVDTNFRIQKLMPQATISAVEFGKIDVHCSNPDDHTYVICFIYLGPASDIY